MKNLYFNKLKQINLNSNFLILNSKKNIFKNLNIFFKEYPLNSEHFYLVRITNKIKKFFDFPLNLNHFNYFFFFSSDVSLEKILLSFSSCTFFKLLYYFYQKNIYFYNDSVFLNFSWKTKSLILLQNLYNVSIFCSYFFYNFWKTILLNLLYLLRIKKNV